MGVHGMFAVKCALCSRMEKSLLCRARRESESVRRKRRERILKGSFEALVIDLPALDL